MVIDSLGWPVVANVNHSGVYLLWELLCKEALKCTEFRSAQPWIFSFEAQAGLWSMRGSDSPVLYCFCCQSHYINFLTSFKSLGLKWTQKVSEGTQDWKRSAEAMNQRGRARPQRCWCYPDIFSRKLAQESWTRLSWCFHTGNSIVVLC